MINPQLRFSPERLAEFCRVNRVKRLSLFGSATRTDFGPASDVDLLVEFDEEARLGLLEFVGLREELSHLFGERPVDLATPAILRNPYRRRAVLQGLETLYAAE